jgi:hypothetical protein
MTIATATLRNPVATRLSCQVAHYGRPLKLEVWPRYRKLHRVS